MVQVRFHGLWLSFGFALGGEHGSQVWPEGATSFWRTSSKTIKNAYGAWTKPMKRENHFEGCKRMLEAKRGELLTSRGKTDGIAVERVSDSMEELALEIEQNMAVDTLNRKTALPLIVKPV